jgi:hypothetical protein
MSVVNSQPVAPPSTTGKLDQPRFAKALDTWTTPIDQPRPGTPPPPEPIIIEKPVRDPTQPSFVDALDRWLTPIPDAKVMKDNNSVKEHTVSSNEERDAPPLPNISSSVSQTATSKPIGKAILIQDELLTSSLVSDPIPAEASAPTEQPPPVHEPSKVQPEITLPQVSGLPLHAQVEPAKTKPLDMEPHNTNLMTVSNQKLLLVHVPPGLPPGATMQVEIPGENRTLAAIVPPGAESFHIAYTPRPFDSGYSTTAPIPGPIPPRPMQTPSTLVPPSQKSRAHSPQGQKLLLVRVPPGTVAGTTLHVSVPDEPGRILAAQVPPGDVQEFHVSYEARPKQHTLGHNSGMTPPMNPYNTNFQQQPQYYHQQPFHPSMIQQPGNYPPHPQSSHTNDSNNWWSGTVAAVDDALATYNNSNKVAKQQSQQYRDGEKVENGHHHYHHDDEYDDGQDYELTDI